MATLLEARVDELVHLAGEILLTVQGTHSSVHRIDTRDSIILDGMTKPLETEPSPPEDDTEELDPIVTPTPRKWLVMPRKFDRGVAVALMLQFIVLPSVMGMGAVTLVAAGVKIETVTHLVGLLIKAVLF